MRSGSETTRGTTRCAAARTPETPREASRTKEPKVSSEGVGRVNSRKNRWGRPKSSSRQNADTASSTKAMAAKMPIRPSKARLWARLRVRVR